MNKWIYAVAFGAALFVGGLITMRRHWLTWRDEKNDPSLEDAERTYYYHRYRRRMQTSGMISLIGLMIALGDTLLPEIFVNQWREMFVFGVYWGAVLLLTGWVIIMAFADLFSASTHSRAALAKLRLKQRELEKQLDEVRRRGSNGHHDAN